MKPSIPICIFTVVAVLHASAADQTWQNANANNTWNTSNLNWDAGAVWTNGNNALFTGTVETVTLGTDPLTAGTIAMSTTAGEWIFAGVFDNLTANSISVATTGSGKLSFKTPGALNHVGSINIASGSLFLGAAFTVNSAVTVTGTGNNENRGALRIEAGGNIAGPVTLTGDTTFGSGGIGTISGNVTAADFSISRAVTGTGTLTLSGALNLGLGGVTQGNAGILVLSGTSPYSGATTVDAGTLTVSGSLTNSPVTVNGGTLNLSGSAGAPLTVNGSGTLNLSGSAGGIVTVNAGTLNLTGSATNTVTLADNANIRGEGSASSLTLGASVGANIFIDSSTAGALTTTGTLTVMGETFVDFAVSPAGPGPVTVLNYGSTTATPAGFGVPDPSKYRQAIFQVGGGSVTLDIGVHNLVWSGATPTWEIRGNEGDWNGGADQFYDADTVTFNGTGANPAISVEETVKPGSTTVSGTTDYSFSGIGDIGGGGSLTKSGAATLTFTNNNSYTGITNIVEGTLVLDNSAGTGTQNQLTGTTGNISIGASAAMKIKVAGAGQDASAYFMSRGLTGSGTLTLENAGATASREINLNGANTGFAGTLNFIRTSGTSAMRARASRMSDATQIAVAAGCQFWDVSPSGQTVGYTFTDLAGTGEGNFGALRVTNGVTYSGGITVNAAGGRISGASSAVATLNGLISGGPLELLGGNNLVTLILNNNSNTPSATSILGGGTGVVRAGGNTVFGTGTLTQSGNTLMSNSTTARSFANPYVIGGNSTLGDATNNGKLTFASTVGLSAATRTIATPSNVEFSGVVSNGGIVHTGTGKMTLSGTGSSMTVLDQQGAGVVEIAGTATITGTGSLLQTSVLIGTASIDIFAGAVLNMAPEFNTIIAQNIANHTGVLNVSGTYNQTTSGIYLGNNVATATGILNIPSGGIFNFDTDGLFIVGRDLANGSVNLSSGGELRTRQVVQGDTGADFGGASAGTSRGFNFNGGTFTALADSAGIAGMTSATINATSTVNTNGFAIAIAQGFSGSGGLIKTGAGTLRLNGANTYAGATTVTTGTIGGTGSIAGNLSAASGTIVAPGASAGTFGVGGNAVIDGSLAIELDGASADQLAVTGTLDIDGATLNVSVLGGGAISAEYVIATYSGALTGTFTGLPEGATVIAGYTISYATTGKIKLLGNGANPYTTWIAGYDFSAFPSADLTPAGDPDSDGQPNGLEFALGGAPNSGSNNAKIYNLVADGSVDADSTAELLMTIAVRSGTPVFAGSPSPTATMDGAVYTVRGSTTLDSFTTGVTPVDPVITGLPTVPAGYDYRTFSLDGSNGLPSKGFLRVEVAEQ